MKKKYTDEQLIEAVKTCMNLQETLNKLNLIGGHCRIKQKIIDLKLDTSHWRNYIGTPIARKIKPVDELLKQNTYIPTSNLKKRLLANNYFNYECSICNISEWNNRYLSLQLDHINGIKTDNRFENLRLLCPNCHSQTETFCGKNTKGIKRKKEEDYVRYPCVKCNRLLMQYTNKLKMCNDCRQTEYVGKLDLTQLSLLQTDCNQPNVILKEVCKKYNISYTTFMNLRNKGLIELISK